MALARMLVIVSTIFILTSSPIVALTTTQGIVDGFLLNRRYHNIFSLAHTINLELGMINSGGSNFFVYVLGSTKFRQELAKMDCFRCFKDISKNGRTSCSVSGRTEERGTTVNSDSEMHRQCV